MDSFYAIYEILLYSDHETFKCITQTNKLLYRLYMGRNDSEHGRLAKRLYEERCQVQYNKKILGIKDNGISWRNLYMCIERIRMKDVKYDDNLYKKCIDEDRFYEFRYYTEVTEYVIKSSILKYSIQRKKKRYLKYMVTQFKGIGVFALSWTINDANIKMVKYLLSIVEPIYMFQRDRLCKKNNIKMLKYVKERYDLLPSRRGADWAYLNKNRGMLKWLEQYDIVPSNEVKEVIS